MKKDCNINSGRAPEKIEYDFECSRCGAGFFTLHGLEWHATECPNRPKPDKLWNRIHLAGLIAAFIALAMALFLTSCTKKDADPYKDFRPVRVSQQFTQPYERFVMSVYRLQPTDTTINGQGVTVQAYSRHNLQDMQSSTEAGLYLFKESDSMAEYIPNESLPGYVLQFNGGNEFRRDTVRGDTSVFISVKMAQFFVDNNPLKRRHQ